MTENTREFTADSFYAYLREESKLMGVRCRACGDLSVEPRPICHACHRETEWYEFSGRGRLATFTCISIVPVHLGQKGYGRNNPYCSGIVELEEGPCISAFIKGVDASNPQTIRTGIGMVLDLEDLDQERPAVAFRPA